MKIKRTVSFLNPLGLILLMVLFGYTSAMGLEPDYEDLDYESFAQTDAAAQRLSLDNVDYHLLNMAIFFETNRQRSLHGLPPFRYLGMLEQSASEHSQDMVAHDFYSHTSVLGDKKSLKMRLKKVGLSRCSMGENIAISFGIEYEGGKSVFPPSKNDGYFSYEWEGEPIKNHTYLGAAAALLEGWMESPGHRENILDPDFEYLGAGSGLYLDPGFEDILTIKATQNFAGRVEVKTH